MADEATIDIPPPPRCRRGGRPRKPAAEKLSRRIVFKVTGADYQRLRERAGPEGVNAYVRRRMLTHRRAALSLPAHAATALHDEAEAAARLLKELAGRTSERGREMLRPLEQHVATLVETCIRLRALLRASE